MLTSILAVVVVAALIFYGKRLQSLPEKERKALIKKVVIYGSLGAVLALVVSGRAHWLMGILAALLALVSRVQQFSQYVPLFKKFMGKEHEGAAVGQGDMTRREAADILGVDVAASEDEIRLAHKRLMQKIHPDRGGSDALAKQINNAKDTLLG